MHALRLATYVMTAAFVLSAAVQFNDPDPVAWVLLYGAAAAVCVLFVVGRLHWRYAAAIAAVALVWAATIVPDLSGGVTVGEVFGAVGMKTIQVELVRELGGLSMVFAWMLLLTIRTYRAAAAVPGHG